MVLFLALAILILALLWWGLLVILPSRGRRKREPRLPLFSAWIIQLSGALVVTQALWLTRADEPFGLLSLVLTTAFPPVGIYTLAWSYQHLQPGISEVAAMPLLRTGLGLGLGLVALWVLGGAWRRWGLFPALMLAAWALLVQLDASAARLIRDQARAFRADCLQMSSFRDSLHFAGREIQTDLHALVFRDGVAYGWSYREAGFYPVPKGFWGDLDEKACMLENNFTQTQKGSP